MSEAGTRPPRRAVIVGGGQAGLTAAVSLRENGWHGSIDLIGNETGAPYQRPPLSKGFLAGSEGTDDLVLRTLRSLDRDEIRYREGVSAESLDRGARKVTLSDGSVLPYDALILATGSRPRTLDLPGADCYGVHTLRTHSDAVALRDALSVAARVVVVGGGFLGLEVAAFAAVNSSVTVLERSRQLLERAVSAPVSEWLAHSLERNGVEIRYREAVSAIDCLEDRVTGVVLASEERVAADVVVVAVGAVPNSELAEGAALDVANGVMVDNALRTADSHIWAIGDCVSHPNVHAGRTIRLESVQNAVDQARYVARELTNPAGLPYSSVPWFWSHQGAQNLQIVGIAEPSDEAYVLTQDDAASKLTVNRVRDGKVVAVETINSPGVHIRARRMLADGPVAVDISALGVRL